MDYFTATKLLPSHLRDFIKFTRKETTIDGSKYELYTYTLKLPKNKFEDDVYAKNPELLKILPRACSILVCDNQIVCSLEGPEKFSGKSDIDEDPEDGQDESIAKATGIYDHQKILSWAVEGNLEIIETEKANGKFAIVKIITHQEKKIILAGSKNNHFVISFDQIISQESNELIGGILLDIKNNWNQLNSQEILALFNSGYSLAGEFCDGQHFTPGDNTISWFGFFKSGQVLDTVQSLGLLNSNGLKTVPYSKVYDTSHDISQIDLVFLASRCKNTEGSVLRCLNTDTGETVLVKTKSVSYIVKRFMRQIILRGYKEIEHLKKRFVDAQKYHGLGTDASIRVTNQLFQFALWMMGQKYPCSVLGITKVSSVKGQLPNGFNTYWSEWLSKTGNFDINISLSDFGEFSEETYLENTKLYQLRTKPAIVIFFQGLQGSGKSTVGSEVCKQLLRNGITAKYIEQDDYWGDTLACQGALHHSIASQSGPNVILVTRCNANISQYKRYLDIAHRLPSIVSFVSPNNFGPLYLMMSLAGIIKRSNVGDNLMVGRFEYPFSEVIDFTVKNFKDFEIARCSLSLDIYQPNAELEELATKSMASTHTIEEFVRSNCEKLNGLRCPIDEITQKIVTHVCQLNAGRISHIVVNTTPTYIGFAVDSDDKEEMNDFVDHHVSQPGRKYIHHCTYEFYGAKSTVKPSHDCLLPGQIVTAHIDSLVIRKADGASVFRISKLEYEGKELKIPKGQPHITAKIPFHEKPACANSFVGLTDGRVEIVNFTKTIRLTCFWS
jgi:hypothetical protein